VPGCYITGLGSRWPTCHASSVSSSVRASIRSGVSNPSVNQSYIPASILRASEQRWRLRRKFDQLILARSSQNFADCPRAVITARSKQASISPSGLFSAMSTVPRRRCSSASQNRMSFCSINSCASWEDWSASELRSRCQGVREGHPGARRRSLMSDG
jgi:hypothetical protein